MFLGENILPFRALEPALAVIPWESRGVLTAGTDAIERYPGLAGWMRQADSLWQANRSSENLTLQEQIDFHGKLSRQFPIQKQRLVYTKSGMHLAAARVENRRAVIDHTLYWATVSDEDEAFYLCAILNAARTTQLVRPLMSYGKDERHIDKYIWKLRIPEYDGKQVLHRELADLGRDAELAVNGLELSSAHFAARRRHIREFLDEAGRNAALDGAVDRLLAGS